MRCWRASQSARFRTCRPPPMRWWRRRTGTSRTRRRSPCTTRPTTATCGCSTPSHPSSSGRQRQRDDTSHRRGGSTVAVKPKIGVLVMALLEDDYNKTAHMRPQATAAAQEIADTFAQWGEVVHAGLVEEEHQAIAAARM